MKNFLLTTCFLLLSLPYPALAQSTPDSMFVCREGLADAYAVSDIDSITYERTVQPQTPVSADHAIDLGLSVRWADTNFGAADVLEQGTLVAWGDPTGEIISTNYFDYSLPASVDTISGGKYDIVRAKWGGKWHTPLPSDWQELIDKCTWSVVQRSGRVTWRVTGPNGNSIYLSPDGYRRLGTAYNRDRQGVYWIGVRSEKLKSYCVNISLEGAPYASAETADIIQGCAVRPVYGDISEPESPDSPEMGVVDLGLSVKWASMNIGATSPEEFGIYYVWGETDHYTAPESIMDISGTDYDVAHTDWGGDWRMPTVDEYKELCERCVWVWVTQNGVNGYKVLGLNGNSIFLPAAGYSLGQQGEQGFYWISTRSDAYVEKAYYLLFKSNSRRTNYVSKKTYGRCVRAVCP